MNPIWGGALALIGTGLAWWHYGWQGLVMALTLVVFWLLLQFGRALRVMRNAATAPKGHVGSAVMIQAQLHRGMTLMQVVALTKSLGQRVGEQPEAWAWRDAGGNSVTLLFDGAKLASWTFARPPEPVALSEPGVATDLPTAA